MNPNNGNSHRHRATADGSEREVGSSHEVILVTGAGGSIGSSLVKHLVLSGSKRGSPHYDHHVRAQHRCVPAWQDVSRTILLLDHSEQNLYEINSELCSVTANHIPILGDVNDASLLAEVFEKHSPTHVFHAAAFKHVPLMEENPIAAVRNNILGTWTLATTAAKYRSRQLTMISTDKAANPRSIMGAAKRVAEQILTQLDAPATRMRSIRLGNVLGSTGSVVPLFQRQIANGGPVTVTHPEARRYFLSLEDATNLILSAAALEDNATLFVPDLDAPIIILDLAQQLIRETQASTAAHGAKIEIVFTGLRPGDKLSEDLLSSSESAEATTHAKLLRVTGSTPALKSIDADISLIREKIQSRDLPALIEAIRALVTDYEPSALLLAQSSAQLPVTAKA